MVEFAQWVITASDPQLQACMDQLSSAIQSIDTSAIPQLGPVWDQIWSHMAAVEMEQLQRVQ